MAIISPPTQINLIIPDGAAFDFLTDVAASDDGQVVVCNAPFQDTDENGENSVTNAGAIYIGNENRIKQKVVAPVANRAANNVFGHHVDVSPDGRVIVASARGELTNSGAIYVITSVNNIWTIRRRISPSWVGTDDRFGFGVAISDDIGDGKYNIVGTAPFYDGGNTNEGRVQVFTYDIDDNSVTEEAILSASSSSTDQNLGYVAEISSDGKTILASTRESDLSGRVYVYYKSGATWANATEDQILEISDTAAANDYYGITNSSGPTNFAYHPIGIDADGSVIIIGAHGSDSNTGLVDIWEGGAGSYSVVRTYTDSSSGRYFGSSVAINPAGDYIAIGLQEYDEAGNQNQGALWAIPKSASSWPASQSSGDFVQADPSTLFAFFAYDIHLSTDYMFSVASDYNTAFSDLGAFYVFRYHSNAQISATDVEVQKPVDYQIEETPIRVPGFPPYKKIPYE